jgi:hypothetical protein
MSEMVRHVASLATTSTVDSTWKRRRRRKLGRNIGVEWGNPAPERIHRRPGPDCNDGGAYGGEESRR